MSAATVGQLVTNGHNVGNNNPLPVITIAGQDSSNNALPSGFANLPSSFTYNSDGTLNTAARTNGANTWTQTMTYNANSQLSNTSAWVKS